ncbi:hypothetical protein HYS11_00670 [Candidatus Gottesmanbacteria bacterium]|nr:hypothetical protein [Candidatus Gottesmanbacteria bacterium]
MNQQKKKTQSQLWSDSFFENFKDIGSGISQGVVDDFAKGTAKGVGQGLVNPFFGVGHGGEALDRQERLANIERKDQQPQQTYYERFKEETILFREQDQDVIRQIEAIRRDLRGLIKQMADLSSVMQEAEKAIAMETAVPGTYHVSFFERLRRIIGMFRKQIAESRTWLSLSQSKKKQRGYWKMYKKHGTTFGLSHERVIATQAG